MKIESEKNASAIFITFLAWLVPGGGHVYLGRTLKGGFLGITVFLLAVIGIYLGGHFYGSSDNGYGFLSYVFGFFDFGLGLMFVLSKILGYAASDYPQYTTAEYGNVFIMIAGLLNYLIALDAFDISIGRKS